MHLDIILNDAKKVIEKVNFSFLENKTIHVTGCTGLLGTHFLATLLLLKEGGMNFRVYGSHHSEPADYTKEIAQRGGFMLFNTGEPWADVIIHAIGYAQPSVFTANPAETIRINTTLTQNLLDSLKPGGKFLFVSSSEVYNGSNRFLVQETDIGTATPSHPRACYIFGKLAGETIVNAYRQSGVDAKSARLCLAYGPGTRSNDQRAMSGFIRQALTTGQIDMQYPGKEFRTFCYIQDAVEIMWNVLLHGTQPVYNVGSSESYRVFDVAQQIALQTNVVVNVPLPNEEMIGSDAVRMSTRLIEEEFGKQEYVSLEEGLANTIAWNRGFYESL